MGAWTIQNERTVTSRVIIGADALKSLQAITGPVFLLFDPRVNSVADRVARALSRASKIDRLGRPIGEAEKTLETVADLYRALGTVGVTRDTVLVVVGGGVMTDLGGFVAATYLRGLSWVAVPTTLLAQVDAAIGGKVAVNAGWGKNLIGAFHLPDWVLLETDFLASLPPVQWRAGLGEVIKSALIAGGALWERLVTDPPRIGFLPDWPRVIEDTARIKIDIVNRDLRESRERLFLNFGHTVGHALENYFGYGRLSHGEAVGLGCLVALRLSEILLGLDPSVRRIVEGWLDHWGLPRQTGPVTVDDLMPALRQDKKARAKGLQWVLLDRVGAPRVVSDVAWEVVQEALAVIRPA